MFETIYSGHISGSGYNYNFHIEIPRTCPRCHVSYGSIPSANYYITDNTTDKIPTGLYAVFYCPNCGSCFFAEYDVDPSKKNQIYLSALQKTYPFPEILSSFSERIERFSPKFVEIYHQSEKAENIGLTEICGIGYRKALEFLIKDYAIYKCPDSKDKIEKTLLGKCINEFIDEPKIKTLAQASTWIGNDETHYIRKHETRNVQDLKHFISATVACIDSDLSYGEALDFLNNPQ